HQPTAAPAPAPHINFVHPPRPSTPPVAPTGGGLTRLAPSPSAPTLTPPARTRGAALTLVPPPGVEGTVTLTREEPVVRMNALQSGVGSLTIRGAQRVAWEDMKEGGGVLEPSGASIGDDMPRYGNRSLLRPLDGVVV